MWGAVNREGCFCLNCDLGFCSQEFRRLHLPGHVLLEDPDSGFFFVAVGQQPGGSQGEPPSAAWAWHSHEDRAEGIEGEVSLSWDDLGMEGGWR